MNSVLAAAASNSQPSLLYIIIPVLITGALALAGNIILYFSHRRVNATKAGEQGANTDQIKAATEKLSGVDSFGQYTLGLQQIITAQTTEIERLTNKLTSMEAKLDAALVTIESLRTQSHTP